MRVTEAINSEKNVLPDLLKLCQKIDRVPTTKEVQMENIVGCSKTLKGICNERGYDNHRDFCRANGYKYKGDVLVDGVYKAPKDLTIEECVILWHDFKKTHGKLPSLEDCNQRTKKSHNLPNSSTFYDLLSNNNMSLNDFKDLVGDTNKKPVIENYDLYINIYKNKSNEAGYPLMYHDIVNNDWGLPDGRWLVKHCPHDSINNFNDFIELCGFAPRFGVSKRLAVKLIKKKQDCTGRALTKKDFANPGTDDIGMATIVNIWGTFNNMKRELGLEIVHDSTNKNIDANKVRKDLENICKEVRDIDGRTTINRNDIREYGKYSYDSHSRLLKECNSSIREFLETIGFDFQQSGTGIIKTFEDGEVTLSQYEERFTKYLRNSLRLEYNVNYIRDVLYSEFIEDYDGYMDCDYVINNNGSFIYVEIAGILRDYKNHYCENKEILSSNSKERYRISLKNKEEMLKSNNLKYYIMFPQDCNEEYFKTIL